MFGMKKEKKGLSIIIVGCGKVGNTIVEQLRNEGHDITVIDKNASRVQDTTGTYDVMGIVGNGASFKVQQEAGIEEADVFISVTESDELNLLCCTVAKQAKDCSTIARVRTPDYSEEANYLRDQLGLSLIINPEFEAAREVVRILCMPNALEIDTFAKGMAEIIRVKVPEHNVLADKKIMEVAGFTKAKALICAVERKGNVSIPSGNFVIKEGDVISYIAERRDARLFMESMGFDTNQVSNTMIVGGGKAAFYLSTQLIRAGIKVKLIESKKERAEELAELLPEAVVINGDGTDEELLREVGLDIADSFVPLTGIDEENIILTLHAKKTSNAKVVTKLARGNFKGVVNSLDLGSVVYPKFITSEAILAFVRAKSESKDSDIEALYHLFDNNAEGIEFKVDKKSEVTDIPLMDLKLKDNLLIALISRNGNVIIPNGADSIQVGDSVVIITKHSGLGDIKDILK